MIRVEELSDNGVKEILARVGYGHLACARERMPYVVPVHFAYADGNIFIFTTEGKKFEIIKLNPNVCLQAEEVIDNQNWCSVIVEGLAEQIIDEDERQKALKRVLSRNPTLTPAMSVHWMDLWVRENIPVLYRITPTSMSGRETINRN